MWIFIIICIIIKRQTKIIKGEMRMLSSTEGKMEQSQPDEFYKELDRGIHDMENGRTISHDEAMKQIRQKVKFYEV